MDAAIVGVMGTAIGGLIGFGGTLLTGWRTSKREERARLFAERRRTYADFLHKQTELLDLFLIEQAGQDFDKLENTVKNSAREVHRVSQELAIVGSSKVRERSEAPMPLLYRLIGLYFQGRARYREPQQDFLSLEKEDRLTYFDRMKAQISKLSWQ